MEKKLKKVLLVLAGNTLYALGIAGFILQNDLMMGGTTGLALIAQNFITVSIPVFVAVFNIALFLVGAVVLGKTFAVTTIISTFYYPFILGQFQQWIGETRFTQDPMLATVCGGLLVGAGIGTVIRAGASTGGMDIPPLILNKKLRLPVSVTIYLFDFSILLGQMAFADREKALYGMVLVLIYTVVIDKILMIGSNQMQVKIISKEYESINHAIQSRMDRGTTLLNMKGGYLKEDGFAILAVVEGRELSKMNELVMEYDDKAFMIINNVNEVRGRGFTIRKKDLNNNNC